MSSPVNLGILPRQMDQFIFLFLQRQLQHTYNRSNFGPLVLGSELRALGLFEHTLTLSCTPGHL